MCCCLRFEQRRNRLSSDHPLPGITETSSGCWSCATRTPARKHSCAALPPASYEGATNSAGLVLHYKVTNAQVTLMRHGFVQVENGTNPAQLEYTFRRRLNTQRDASGCDLSYESRLRELRGRRRVHGVGAGARSGIGRVSHLVLQA